MFAIIKFAFTLFAMNVKGFFDKTNIEEKEF